ncbi:helix-turn-helix domain-containing protein [Neorhizobium sp. NPDC001467]|uniref:helix-turn-helix domain-containing protein n=1 Tax=Neorhizobium sp. NPDC001467 TaxID=3390595 RepID=UPI003D007BD7
MHPNFSIRVVGTCPAAAPPPEPAPVGLPAGRICRAVRLLVWEAMVLAGGRMADFRERGQIASHVRQIAMYVCHVTLSLPMTAIAGVNGCARSTVRHACHITEDRRDNPSFDAFVACVERMALAAFGRPEGFEHD